MTKTYLLTGGLGYIGSHIAVNLLMNNDNFVIIIDNLSNSDLSKLETLKKHSKYPNNLIFYKKDLIDEMEITAVFEKHRIVTVIHLAGLKSVNESVREPILYYYKNLLSTMILIKIMDNFNCRNLIFSSSATVYGNLNAPFKEDMIVGNGITNPYGKTKYMQEEIFKDLYTSNNKWNIILLRYFNPIGHKNIDMREIPNGIPNNLFPYIVKVHLGELKNLNIYGNNYDTPDGTCIRDFIHVNDLALAHIKACEYIFNNNNSGFKIYNIGTGNGISVQKLIDTFEKVNNTKLNYNYVERRQGDVVASYADCTLANSELGWHPIYTIEDMVRLN